MGYKQTYWSMLQTNVDSLNDLLTTVADNSQPLQDFSYHCVSLDICFIIDALITITQCSKAIERD